MSALQTLRNKAGLLISIFIGFALLAFILTDLLSSGQSMFSGTDRNIAVVNGESIDAQKYFELVNQIEENYANQSGSPVDKKMRPNLLRQAWDELINQVVLEEQLEKLGLGIRVPEHGNIIGVTPDELKDMVVGKNVDPQIQQIFRNQETGIYDREIALNFLRNMDFDQERKAIWLSIEKGLMLNRVQTKYNTLLSKGMYVTEFAANEHANEKNQKIDIQYLALKYNSIPDSSISISESEITSYFNNNKNLFKQEASREIEYVSFDINPSQDDFINTEKWITSLVDEFKFADNDILFVNSNSDIRSDEKFFKQGELNFRLDTFAFSGNQGDILGPYFEEGAFKLTKLSKIEMLPDSVRARHILLTSQNAVAEADSLILLIKSGQSFAKLAQENSEDKASAIDGGNLGWFSKGQMVKQFDDTCFFGEIQKLYKVYTQFGVHIVEVLEKSELSKKVQLATIITKVEASTATRNQIYSKAGAFASKINNKESFNTELQNEKLTKRIASNIKQSDHLIQGLDNARELVKWTSRAKLNTSSEVFECGNKYVVAVVSKIKEDGIPSLENVKSEVEMKLIVEKKAQILKNKISEAGTSNIQELANKLNTTIEKSENIDFTQYSISGIGAEPKIIGYISGMENGQTSNAIDGNNGVYIVSVINSKAENIANAISEKQVIKRSLQSQFGYSATKTLKEVADIEDNRIDFE